jgi:adenylate cyclase
MARRNDSPVEDDEPAPTVVAERLARLIDNSPAVRDAASEVGLVDRTWLLDPARRVPKVAPPVEVLRRLMERIAERHPSALANVGVSALQVLSWDLQWDRGILGSRDAVNHATVVFTDLEGFTAFTNRHGDAAAIELLAEHQKVAAAIVRRWGGRVVKHLGDGLMLIFPHAANGVHAALELVPSAPDPVRMRAGVHTGDLVVVDGDILGHVVNVAARVTGAAKGGEVLASAATLAEAGPLTGVRVYRGRRRSFKGVEEKILVSRLELVPVRDE